MAIREKCTYCPAMVKPKFRAGHERDVHYSQVKKQEREAQHGQAGDS